MIRKMKTGKELEEFMDEVEDRYRGESNIMQEGDSILDYSRKMTQISRETIPDKRNHLKFVRKAR